MKTLKLLLPLLLMSILSASAQKQSILRHQPGVIGDKGVRNEIYIPKVMVDLLNYFASSMELSTEAS